MSKTHKTAKGTELPILNLRGKDYLEVKYRLVWFREEHPDWSIETELVATTEKSACAKATVRDGAGRVLATSHKFENERGFPDFIEKAETGAIGRALALVGYGTQFCADELDEGERIVDSPVSRQDSPVNRQDSPVNRQGMSSAPPRETADSDQAGLTRVDSSKPGEFRVPFGRKYRGKKISEIPQDELESYIGWLEEEARKKSVPLSFDVRLLKKAFELYQGGSTHSDELEAAGS